MFRTEKLTQKSQQALAAAEPNPAGGMHRVAEEALDELLQGKIEVKRD